MISTIIPCYNCVDTIEECIDSLVVHAEIKQIICVINGCTDHTQDVIAELAKKYPQIEAVSIDGAGPGLARNAGVPYVKQPFTFFMDADDFMHQESFQKVLNELSLDQHIDFISFEHTNKLEKLGKGSNQVYAFSNFKAYYKYTLGRLIFAKNIRIINSDIVKRKDVYYAIEIMGAEDMYFLQLLVLHAKKYKHIEAVCYYYREDSIGTGVVKNNSPERLRKKFSGLKWAQKNRVKSPVSKFLNRYYMVQYLNYAAIEFKGTKNRKQALQRLLYTFRPYSINIFRKMYYQFLFLKKIYS